jgi:hypothetical protein
MKMFSFRDFLYYAEQLYEDAKNKTDEPAANPYIIGSILNSWMSMESFINNMMQDFTCLPEEIFTIHERGFLEEKQVRFADKGRKAGTFYLENKQEYRRLEDKVLFLLAKFGKSRTVDRGTHIWQRFEKIKDKRNALSHPRRTKIIELTLKDAQEAIEVAKSVISLVSKEVWKKSVTW